MMQRAINAMLGGAMLSARGGRDIEAMPHVLSVDDESSAATGGQDNGAAGDASNAAGGNAGGAGTPPADGATVLGAKPGDPATPPADGVKPGAADPKAKEGDGAATVPEAYEFKMPEGMTADPARAEEFSAVAKELKLTQEQAQKLVDLDVKRSQDQLTAHAETVKTWATELKADKEFGGDNLPATTTACKKVMDQFATPALREYLDASGLGNHPELVKFVANIGKSLSEDSFVRGGPTTTPTDSAKRFYPNSNMN
jgi:hypothetical protein